MLGKCTIITCSPGFADCDGDSTNGCESSVTSTTACGPTCLSCTAPTKGTATCDGTSCGFTCATDYVKSDAACVPCGGAGQACCNNSSCNSPLVCTGTTCGEKVLTWSQVTPSPTFENLGSVWESAGGMKYIVGTTSVFSSSDGKSWSVMGLPIGPIGNPTVLWGSDVTNTVYLGTTAGQLLTSRGGAFAAELLPSGWDHSGIEAIWGDNTASHNVYIATDSTTNMMAEQNGTLNTLTVGYSTRAIWSTAAVTPDIYVTGSDGPGSLLHSKGGSSWQKLAGLPSTYFLGIWGTAAGDIYLIGNKATLVHGTVGGTTWTQQTLPAAVTANGGLGLYAIWGSDQSGYVYIVGAGGLIMHSIGNGTWVVERNGDLTNNPSLFGVWGAKDGSEVWAIGDSGTILYGQ